MKFIIQIIPKLDEKMLSNKTLYNYKGEKVEATLPSQTIKIVKMKEDNAKIIAILPVSLREQEDSIKSIVDTQLVIPSIGKYNGKVYGGNYDQIVATIFSGLVMEYLRLGNSEKLTEVIVEISRGQNIYVSALIDALRNFIVFLSLTDLRKNYKRDFSAVLAFAEPVVGDPEQEIRIFDSEFSWSTFFTLPIESASKNILLNKLPRFFRDFSDENEFRKMIQLSIILFCCIEKGVILPLFYVNLPSSKEFKIWIERLAEGMLRKIEENQFEEIRKFDARLFIRVIQSFALSSGILTLIESKNIALRTDEEGYVSLNILELFVDILKEIGEDVASRFLNREINELKTLQATEKPTRLSELRKGGEKEQNSVYSRFSDIERNFFAHAGFEKSSVEIINKDGEIKVRFVEDKAKELRMLKGEIFNWLTKGVLTE